MILLMIALLLCAVYLLSTAGRRNHPGLAALRRHRYAHRGLHGPGRPENSMAAFQAALDAGYGVELDVHLLADGELAVMHDSCLLRTTGQNGSLESLTAKDLQNYRLEGSEETIPLLRQVLSLFKGRVPLIIELKTADNAPRLCKTVCDLLDSYDGAYCLESFDPRCVLWLKKHRPELIRGQLSENFLKRSRTLPLPVRFLLTVQALNFLSRPDFVAYRFEDRKRLSNFLVRRVWGVQGISWTLHTQEEFDKAVKEGWIPIFEGFQP